MNEMGLGSLLDHFVEHITHHPETQFDHTITLTNECNNLIGAWLYTIGEGDVGEGGEGGDDW